MRLLLLVLSLLGASWTTLGAQANQYESAADSDPEARALLEKLRLKYEGMDPLEARFTLTLLFPEQPEEVQEGTLLRSGEKYRVRLGQREILSDGNALYLILHQNKEVQINDLPEEGEAQGAFSPQAILRLHESDQFVYVMGGRVPRDGRVLQQIEFKPLDPYADYAKLRMEIDPSSLELVSATAFGKDGSRYIFTLERMAAKGQVEAGTFSFRESDYPGYYLEDLRQ